LSPGVGYWMSSFFFGTLNRHSGPPFSSCVGSFLFSHHVLGRGMIALQSLASSSDYKVSHSFLYQSLPSPSTIPMSCDLTATKFMQA
ncbi:hypothetical protein KCU64_g102, partial [Aureobasidium melanogenum]